MKYAAMRRLFRSVLILPIQPRSFKLWARIVRLLGKFPAPPKRRVGSSNKILVVSLTKHVGDVVMMLPLIEALRTSDIDAEIEVAVEPPMAEFLRSMTAINRVHSIDCGMSSPPVIHLYRRIWRIVRYYQKSMRGGRYDICLLPRWGVDPTASAYLAYLSNAPIRIGQDSREEIGADAVFSRVEILLTKQIAGGQGLPESLRQVRVLTEAGLLAPVDFGAAEYQYSKLLNFVSELVDFEGLCSTLNWDSTRSYAVLAPGASHASRQWPTERFAEVARFLHAKYGLESLVIGSKNELQLGLEMEQAASGMIHSVVGKTDLFESAALLSHASLFIGNDSGPGHIAAGLGTPSVIVSSCPSSSKIEGPNSPSRVRPVGPHVRVVQPANPQSPCRDRCHANEAHCIAGVTWEEIAKSASEMIVDAESDVRVIKVAQPKPNS